MPMNHHRRALALGILLATMVACSQRQAANEAIGPAGAVAADAQAPAGAPVSTPAPNDKPVASTVTPAEVAAQLSSSAATYTDTQRKFIRTAHAAFRVKDVYRSTLAIEDIVAAQGGFVVSNDINAQTQNTQTRATGDGELIELTGYTLHGELVVRVPSEKTQGFLRAIVGQIDFLDERRFEASDAQFELLRQQLAYQRGQEAQAEIGQAEQQGGKLDQKTEALQGRDAAKAARDEALIAQKEFEDKVAFSTIDLSMYQTPKIRATEMVDVDAEFQKNSPGFFTRLASSLKGGWYGLLEVVVALAALWPLWLALIAVVTGYRFLRRKRAAGGGS
jgi:hypothetical protein